MLPAASDISRLSRAIQSGIIPHRTGRSRRDDWEETCLPGKRRHNSDSEQPGCGAGKSGLRQRPPSPAMVAQWPSGRAEVLAAADSGAKAATAGLCSAALLPLPFPPSALHPQTQKHSSPGLSPAACSSPGFAAECRAPRSCWQKSLRCKWPGQYPDTAVFPLRNGVTFRKHCTCAPRAATPGAPDVWSSDHRERGQRGRQEGESSCCWRYGPQPTCHSK